MNRRNLFKTIMAGAAGFTVAAIDKSKAVAGEIKEMANPGADEKRQILSYENKHGEQFKIVEDKNGNINISLDKETKIIFPSPKGEEIRQEKQKKLIQKRTGDVTRITNGSSRYNFAPQRKITL